jgi:hypothetical protein
MTEAEWLSCDDPERMLEALRGRALGRKVRLFMAACCRRVWHDFEVGEEQDRQAAVEVAERYADGLASDDERDTAFGELTDGAPHRGGDCCSNAAVGEFDKPHAAVDWAITAVEEAAYRAVGEDYDNREPIERAERAVQAGLLRDVVSNPFRPTLLDPAWQAPTVDSLARAAYEERTLPAGTLDPARLAVLADALEEAGCADAEMLGHLRSPGPHVRGCWALDLLLGKS